MENKSAVDTNLPSAELFDGLPVAVYTCDSKGYITSYNKAAAELWGRTPAVGKDLWCGSWKIFWPDGRPMELDACPMAKVLKEGVVIKGEEILIQRPDGERRNVLPSPVPFYDSSGKIIGAVNTLIDITEQKLGEKKQAMLAAIIESSEDAIISKNLKGEVSSWNKTAEKVFGYSEEEMLGKHISILIPKDRIEEEDLIIEKIRNNEHIHHFETVRITKDGSLIPLSLTISPIRDARGTIIGASKIARDISDQKRTEAQLQKLYDDIQELNLKKDEFIGLASHELKTPVTSISAFLQLVERSLSEQDPIKVLVSKARNQVGKLTSLVSDLLDVSKIQTGKLPFNFTSFDLVRVLKEVVEIMQQTNPLHHILLNCGPDELIVEADQLRIEQVIINLISNAVKYAPNTERIIIECQNSGNMVKVVVQDFGQGIALDEQELIFSRFYRVQRASGIAAGLGIGLYISHEIIARHRGRLWVESEADRGSAFQFEMPLIQAV